MKQILREIGMIDRCFETILNIEFKDHNLARGQYVYLIRICENPGIIQERLVEMLKVDKTSASRAIQKLVLSGFIEKEPDNENRKILKLFPTEKGTRIHAFLTKEESYSTEVALNGFAEEERELLLKLLRKIRGNIEVDWQLVKKGEQRSYLIESNKINFNGRKI